MNLVWRGRGTTFESLPCQSRVARQSLSNLIALPNLIQKFDSDAVPLIPEFSSARQKHDVWTGPKLTRNLSTETRLTAVTVEQCEKTIQEYCK